MKRNRIVETVFLALLTIWVGSCAKPPDAEMEAATAAVGRAEADADARQYASESVARAKNLLARMQAEAEAKRYDSARTAAQEAADAADKAITDGAAAKTRAQEETASFISAAKSLLAEAERALNAAKQLRGIAIDFDATAGELSEVGGTIAAAETDMANGAFSAAGTKAQSARSAISAIQLRVSDAVQAASRRK